MTTETITFQWSREYGDCYECGRPAAFYLPDEIGLTNENKRCSVCAANNAADGERIERIDVWALRRDRLLAEQEIRSIVNEYDAIDSFNDSAEPAEMLGVLVREVKTMLDLWSAS